MVFSNFTLKRLDYLELVVERMDETIRGAEAAVNRLIEKLAYADAHENGFQKSFLGDLYEEAKETSKRGINACGVEDTTRKFDSWGPTNTIRPEVHAEGSESVQESASELGKRRQEKNDAHQEALDLERDYNDTTDKLEGWRLWLEAGSPFGQIVDYMQEARRVRLRNEV